jgi:hypothetical protein
MAYAEVAHMRARAGYLADAWTEESRPSTTDLSVFLEDVAAELNAAIGGLGLDVPDAGSPAALALRGMNADGALLLALDATFPAGEGPEAATALQAAIRARYDAAWALLREGKLAAVAAISADDPEALFATDFWTENPDYGQEPRGVTTDPFGCPNVALDPAVYRGMGF